MKPLRFVSPFVAACACAGAVLAQAEPSLSRAEVRALTHSSNESPRVAYDAPSDGTLWAGGGNYKASFDAMGATYYPHFSSCQPKSYAHALSPTSVTIAGDELVFDRYATATRDGDRIAIDRGAFSEQYDLSPTAVEQSFVFDTLPVRGELVLRIEPGSELEQRDGDQALEFRHPLGRTSYGRAVAIDAAGRRVSAPTRFVDGAIEIRVAAEFVRDASLPLVIDPIVQTLSIDTWAFTDDFYADCAYDAVFSRWFVTYTRQYSATDADVVWRMYDDAGTELNTGYIDISTTNWSDPACTSLTGWHNFLIVAGVGPTTSQEIHARSLSAINYALSPDHLISFPAGSGNSYRHPSIGTDPTNVTTEWACVAYEVFYTTGSSIWVDFIRGDATPGFIGSHYFSGPTNTFSTWPAVSKSNGGYEWLIAWSRELSPTVAQIWGARVDWEGDLVAGQFPITTQSFTTDRFPSVSSPIEGTLGRRSAVAYERSFFGDEDIEIAIYDGTTRLSETNLGHLELGVNNTADQTGANIDCDGQHFLCTYVEATSATNSDVRASEMYSAAGGLAITEGRVLVGGTANNELRPAVVSKHASGGAPRKYLLAWDVGSGTSQRDVLGAFFAGDYGGAVTSFCGGSSVTCPCGNGGTPSSGCANSAHAGGAALSVSGHPSTVLDDAAMHVTGLPANVPCLLFEGTTAVAPAPFGDGLKCVPSPVLRFPLRQADGGGVMSYPSAGDPAVSALTGIPLVGGARFYQAWYRDSANFCTSATYNISNAVRIDWAP